MFAIGCSEALVTVVKRLVTHRFEVRDAGVPAGYRGWRFAMAQRHKMIAGTALAALALSACGLGEAPEGESEEPQTEELDLGEVEGEITFQTMQLSPTFDDFINGLIDEFEEEYPEVSVEWVDIPTEGTAQKIAADASSGNLADVLDLDVATLAPIARGGRVLDMAQVSPESEPDFVESAWESFAFEGIETSALPWYLNTPVLIMNTEILQEAGLSEDDNPDTWAELFDLSSRIASDTDAAGFQPTVRALRNMMISAGVPMVNEDATEAVVNTPEALEIVESLAELYENGGIPKDSMTAQPRSEIESFQDAEVAFFETGPSRIAIIEENAPEVFDALAIAEPLESTGKGAWVVAHGLAVSDNSEHKAAALEFARFVTSADQQLALAKESTVFPSNNEALEDPFFTDSDGSAEDEGRAIAAENLASGQTAPAANTAIDTEFEEELWSEVQLAIMGDEDPSDALERAEQTLTELLEQRNS